MLQLSFTTINNCLQPTNSHNWINKVSGQVVPRTEDMMKGERLHRLIAERMTKDDKPFFRPYIRDLIKDFEYEQETFDPKTKRSMVLDYKGKQYEIFGYMDAIKGNTLLEIKTGRKWSLSNFLDSMQIKLYGLIGGFTEAYCLSFAYEEDQEKITHQEIFHFDITDKMKEKAKKWVTDAIDILEAGEYKGGLDEQSKCNIFCYYQYNCLYRK